MRLCLCEHFLKNEGVDLQKRQSGKVARKCDGASHRSGYQLLTFAALILAAALVCFHEGLADAQRRRKGERARQLLRARNFNWRLIQLGHFSLKLLAAYAFAFPAYNHIKTRPHTQGARHARQWLAAVGEAVPASKKARRGRPHMNVFHN